MSVYASKVVRNFFGTEPIRAIFSDEARVANYLRIEVALAKVEAQLGVIPTQAWRAIEQAAHDFAIDWERYRQDVEAVGYPVMPFLKQLAEHCGDAGEYLHWGSTTRDITDTSFALQLQQALAVVETDVVRVKRALANLTETHRDTIMVARTHGMHALPTTFGFRTAIWLSEVDRQLARLRRLREQGVPGQFGGAVGTLAALEGRGLEVQRALMQELGLQAPDISWFASRDRIAEIGFVLASTAQSMASICKTLLVMTRNEVGEAQEPDPGGRGTSSAMPHKHNSVGAELVLVHGRAAASQLSLAIESMVQDYDRDWQGHYETIAVPQAFLHAHGAVALTARILEGLRVFPQRMRANLDLTKGQIMAESVMMALAPRVGRKRAHELVSKHCNLALERDAHLGEVLGASGEIAALLGPGELERALDPASYVGQTGEIIDTVLARTRGD